MNRADLVDKLRVYLVTPDGWGTREEDEAITRRLLESGLRTVQFRDKSGLADREDRAQRLQNLCREFGALFIVNDDPVLAKDLDADGVHVGEEDASVSDARAILGADKVVGATAGSVSRALAAVTTGADYLGVGAIYDASASKPNATTKGLSILTLMRKESALVGFPIVAIGGIDGDNAEACFDAGADAVAMIRALWRAENPETLIRRLRGIVR